MNKQIEELANAYYEAMIKASRTLCSMNEGAPKWYAKELYNAGYRKQSDTAREIFAETIKTVGQIITSNIEGDNSLVETEVDIVHALAELKKKYGVMEDESEEKETT